MASIHTSRIGHRFVCWHIGRTLDADQLGPDLLPIIRPQIAPAHGAIGGALDGDAALDGDRAYTRGPLPHQLRLHADGASQPGATTAANQEFRQLHGAQYKRIA